MKIDYIHFYVKDAKASRDWFVNHMGFQALASGASRHTLTAVVRSGAIKIVLSSPLTSASPVALFLSLHPPGIADIAFEVSDLEGVLERAVANGAKVLEPFQQQPLALGGGKWAKIAAWGSLTHTLTESYPPNTLLPIWSDSEMTQEFATPPVSSEFSSTNLGLFTAIDHVVLNVAAGDLELALSWYEEVLGFQRQQRFTIQTDRSGLRSQVLVHPSSGVQFPINEPTAANSQIQEFLDVNQGPGIQHIALQTPGIVKAIAQLRHVGLSFLPIPPSYYTQLRLNYPGLPLSLAELGEIAAQEILVDWQDESSSGLLLQIFTQPIFEEPTFFFELIERRQQAQGFGEGNFRALFEAIEREQMKRGSLPLG
jgi:4-hydroxyphenylpyruvate dioxygenase